MATKQIIEFGKLHSSVFFEPVLEIGSKIYPNYTQFSPRTINSQNSDYLGIDIAEGSGVDQIVNFSEKGIVQKLGWEDRFNTIHCHCILEHVPDIFTFSKNIQQALNTSGVLFITVPFAWKIHRIPVDMWRFTPQGIDYLFPKICFKVDQCAFSIRKKDKFFPIDIGPEFHLGSRLEENGKILSYTIRLLRKLGFDKGYFRERALLFESNLMMIGIKSNEERFTFL